MLSLTPKRKTALIFSGSFLLIVFVTVFWLLPTLIKEKLPALIEQTTGKPATLAQVQVNLLPLSLRLRGFSLNDQNRQPMVAVDEFYLEIDTLHSISRRALVINKLSLHKPLLQLGMRKDGTMNIDGLSGRQADNHPVDNKLFPVTVNNLSLTEGKLVYEDARQAQTATVDPLQLEINNFSTFENLPSSLKLSLATNSGGHADWTGTLSINPFRSEGRIQLSQIDLKKIPLSIPLSGLGQIDFPYQADYSEGEFKLAVNNAKLGLQNLQYSQAGLSLTLAEVNHETDFTLSYKNQTLRLTANKAKLNARQLQLQQPLAAATALLSAESAYQLNYTDKQLNLLVTQASLETKNLQLSQPQDNKPVADIAAIALHGIDFNLGQRDLKIGAIAVSDADVKAWRQADGAFNYQAFMPTGGDMPTAGVVEGETVAKTNPWQIQAQNLSLSNCALTFTDETLSTPTVINLKPVDLTLSGYNNQPGTRLPVTLNVGVNKTGFVKLNGDASLSPIAAKLDVAIENIDLEKFQNYFAQFIRLDVIDGKVNIDGKLEVALQDRLNLTFNGNTAVADFLTRDQRIHKDFIKWLNLNLGGIHVDTLANRYTADELTITRPYTRVTIRKDKTVNYANLLISETNTAANAKPVTPKSPQPPLFFKLGKIRITDASTNFSDLSLILPFAAYIQDMEGGASDLSSETDSIVKVALKGKAYDLSSVDITGEVSPYLGDYDVKVNFNGLPMPLVSPYMVQFAGYKVEKGKLSLGLNYKVANKRLTASNKFLIDQFELGEKVDNPDAVSVPLKLAVALLKDSSGKIKFDFPIAGSLENPEFSIAAIVADALSNALTKIISSPFAALASLSDGKEDLSTVSFSAGSAELDQPQQAKLQKLAAALRKRPALTIGIKGTAYQRQDWPAISDDALFDQLKIRRAEELNKDKEVKTRPEYIKLSDEEYRRLLADLFIEKFPALAEKSLFGVPQLKLPQAGDFYTVAKQKLMEVINPEQERLKELSVFRARAIAKYIVQNGQVPQEQVYILDTVVDKEKDSKEILSLLSLKAD